DIALTGGEPTIHPSYLDFIQYILQKNPESRVMTQTNLSLKGGVYQKFYDRFKNSAVRLSFWASYHFEQANRETFLGNANILSQAFPVKIIVMAHPEHMHDVRQLYEYVSSLDNPNLKIYVKLIRENFGAIPDKRYTQQDLDWLTNFWNSYEGDTVEDFFDKVKVYMQSPTNEGCETRNYTPDDLINKDLNNFKGMLCNAGIEALSIDQFGNMAPAVCLRGAKIKKPNIFKDKDPLKHFQKPIRCPKNKCGCLADIPITKWTTRYLNNFHEKELVSNHDENKRGEKQSQESEDPKEKFQNKINNPLNKVLLLARSFPPYDGGNIGRSLRIYHLANFLAANNYEVYVFIFHKLVQDREHPEIHKNIKLLNHDFNARNKNFQDINDVTDYCSEIINNYNIDTIISSSPPLDAHIVAKNIKQKNRIIFWICDIRNITSMHMNLRKKNKKEHMIQKHQEVETISYADAITTVSTGASKIINDLYNEVEVDRSLSKIYVVENGYIDTENVPAQKEVLSYINEARYENRIILYYAGTGIISGNRNIMKSKDVTLLIDNIANYEDIRNNFALIIQGNVAINEEYIKKIHPKVKLKILPRVENKQIRSNLKNADIGVIVSRDYISAPTLMSGKLYDYISCGLSLFLIIPENSYSRLEFASKHDKKVFIANPHKDNSIKDAFYKILNLKANLNEIKFVKNEVLQYNRYLQYEKILEILKNKNYKIYNDFSCIHNGSAFKHVPSESLPPDIKVSPNKNDDSNLLQHLDNIGWEEKTEIYSQYFESVTFLKKIDNPKMSIVVISWRLHPDTIKNFQILEKQRDQNFELIFVDNGGKPGEFDELKPFIDTYVRLNSNTGAYLARNVGAAFAKAPILFFLEDDGIPADDIVQAHLDAHEKYDVIAVRGVYQPKTNNPLNEIAKHYYLGPKPFPRFGDLEGNISYRADT
ncbi:MAG: glycosyltransferase, partial [bacterium]